MPMPGGQMPMPVPAPMGPPPIIAKVQRIGKALKLLRDDAPRGYRITIETDSTVAGEIGQERSDSIQFISATTKYLEQLSSSAHPIRQLFRCSASFCSSP